MIAEQEAHTLSGKDKHLSDEMLAEFSSHIRGQLYLPNTMGYDEMRKIWNGMIDRRPALIVRCSGTADIIQAVKFARQNDLIVSVRGAGHNIAGKSLQDGTMLIDLSGMRSVRVDPEHKRAWVGPGATLADVDHETQAYGLAVPTGINSTTGIAGLTLGGGFGWLSRSLGLTIDNLLAAEVITASGERLYCTAEQHADLFWAIRGGGGNFGIVSLFEFKLHPVGPMLMCGPVVYPFSQAKQVLQKYRDFCPTAPDELTSWVVMRSAPPLPFLPGEHHGKPVVIVVGVYNGSMGEGERQLKSIQEFGNVLGSGIGPHPFAAFQQAFDPLLTPGARNYWKSHNFTELNDELIDTLIAYAADLPSPQSEIFIAQLGGAVNRVATDATAYPHRDANFVMNVHTRWEPIAEDNHCTQWARKFFDSTKPFATGGVYVNFISEGEERVDNAYGQNYVRLKTIKQKYDPDNFFRVNQNISPA